LKITNHICRECPEEQNNQKIQPQRPNHDIGPGKRGKLRRIKTNKLKRINDFRKKSKGAAHLTYYLDDDDEADSWIDIDQLSNGEFEFAFAASSTSEDLLNNDEAAAMMLYEGEYINLPIMKYNKMIEFIIDCASMEHIINDRSCFVTFRCRNFSKIIKCANGDTDADLIIDYQGNIVLMNDKTGKLISLKNVQFSEKLPANLFSVNRVKDKLMFVIIGKHLYIVERETSKVLKTAYNDGRFWKMSFTLPKLTNFDKRLQGLEGVNQTGGSREDVYMNISFSASPPKTTENAAFLLNDDCPELLKKDQTIRQEGVQEQIMRQEGVK